jgi:splicing factor 45
VKKLIIVSAYFAYDRPILSNKLLEIINYSLVNKVDILIGCDANSHHENWRSSDINRRGSTLMEFIAGTNLLLLK